MTTIVRLVINDKAKILILLHKLKSKDQSIRGTSRGKWTHMSQGSLFFSIIVDDSANILVFHFTPKLQRQAV